MYLEKLKRILPPPSKPFKTGSSEEWDRLEETLGTGLPKDYKEFIGTYGAGGIDHFIWLFTPFVQDENVNFLKRSKVIRDAYLTLREQFPKYYKHKIYPEPGGLLPLGVTDNGDELYWLTEGEPAHWPIVVYETRSSVNYEYPMTVTEFLYKVIAKEMVCEAFPDDFQGEKPEFTSVDLNN